MTSEQLANLEKIRKLKIEAPTAAEFMGLIRSGSIRLKDSANETLDLESRFDLAYNAAHALALAALRWHGYRSAEVWRVFNAAHIKRNVAEYQGKLDFDQSTVAALIRVTKEIERRVCAHPSTRASTTISPNHVKWAKNTAAAPEIQALFILLFRGSKLPVAAYHSAPS